MPRNTQLPELGENPRTTASSTASLRSENGPDLAIAEASIERQGKALDSIIRSCLGEAPQSILDVSCGIGTQCLAALGHRVTGSSTSLPPRSSVQGERQPLGAYLSTLPSQICAHQVILEDVISTSCCVQTIRYPISCPTRRSPEHSATSSPPSNPEDYVSPRSETTPRRNAVGFRSSHTASAPRKAPGGSFFNCGIGVAQSTIYSSTSWLTTGSLHV